MKKAMNKLRLLVLAVVCLLPIAAFANEVTIGNITFKYFDSGETLVKVAVDPQVYVYAVLTSAETTDLREIYEDDTRGDASGGSTDDPPTYNGPTMPQHPSLGDLTD